MIPLASAPPAPRTGAYCRSKYTEITEIPPLNVEQRTLLEGHGLLNIYNVIHEELKHLGTALGGDPQLMRGGIGLCEEAVAALHRPESLYATAAAAIEHEKRIFREVEAQLRRAPENAAGLGDCMSNLRSLLRMLQVRAGEIVQRKSSGDGWVSVPVALLEADFRDAFAAIEQNSHGRYRLVFNPGSQRANDYHLALQIDAGYDTAVVMPQVFTDVIRDLVANARKYTAPGGRIRATLRASPQGLRLTVEDTGRGIPPREIPAVVRFGVRGSNVGDVRTMGGGFGLTKAFVVAKRFGGRLWIGSELGVGTRVRIWLPPPTRGVRGWSEIASLTSARVSNE